MQSTPEITRQHICTQEFHLLSFFMVLVWGSHFASLCETKEMSNELKMVHETGIFFCVHASLLKSKHVDVLTNGVSFAR